MGLAGFPRRTLVGSDLPIVTPIPYSQLALPSFDVPFDRSIELVDTPLKGGWGLEEEEGMEVITKDLGLRRMGCESFYSFLPSLLPSFIHSFIPSLIFKPDLGIAVSNPNLNSN